MERRVYCGKGGKGEKWWKDQLLLINKGGKIGVLQIIWGEYLDFVEFMS